jgi:hypothetical protein
MMNEAELPFAGQADTAEVRQTVLIAINVRDSYGNAWCPGAACYHDRSDRASTAEPCLYDTHRHYLNSGRFKVSQIMTIKPSNL